MATAPTFTHLINPFSAKPGSEHDIAQRMTMASIRTAIDYAKARGTTVDLVAACYEEDIPSVQPPARLLPLLTRSVQDIQAMTPVYKFPLVGDLIQTAAANSDGEYLIYSNVDITLQPYFYHHVARMLRWLNGYAPALVINRRTVSHASDPAELPKLYAEYGSGHLGYDCFVFPRAWAAKLDLGTLCIGTHLFDSTLFAMIDLQSGFRTRCCCRQQLTFHLGDDGYLQLKPPYQAFNQLEATRLMKKTRENYQGRIPFGSEFSRRELLINEGKFVGRPVPLLRKAVWRAVEEISLRMTRRLLRAYLKEIGEPQPD